jgi:hypothetical protein
VSGISDDRRKLSIETRRKARWYGYYRYSGERRVIDDSNTRAYIAFTEALEHDNRLLADGEIGSGAGDVVVTAPALDDLLAGAVAVADVSVLLGGDPGGALDAVSYGSSAVESVAVVLGLGGPDAVDIRQKREGVRTDPRLLHV